MANGFKSGGREAGTPNKRKAIGKRIEEFLEYEWDNIHSYMEEMTHKEKAEFIVKLLHYATPKYSHKNYDQDIMDTPLFRKVQILDTVDEKERMDRVRAYEEKHGLEIL
tara:strand:- start:1701 stop:2027 length:327 start_codon:yes stop_codon:yes gene_type:complete